MVEVGSGIFQWAAYSPAHKVPLSSHACLTDGGLFIFDPIRVPEVQVMELKAMHSRRHIVLSNSNHIRDARWWSERLGARVLMRAGSSDPGCGIQINTLDPKEDIWRRWGLFSIEGGPESETAFNPPGSDAWIFGDALVNLPPRGLEVLPAKYCLNHDQRRIREDLAGFLGAHSFNRAFFAHGSPWLSGASEKLRRVLSPDWSA